MKNSEKICVYAWIIVVDHILGGKKGMRVAIAFSPRQ